MAIETEIQDLYALIRGAKFANTLQDAAAAAGDGDYSAASRLVGAVREQFERKHSRTLKRDLNQVEAEATQEEAKRLASRQEKYRDVLLKFDEVLTALNRRAARVPQERSSNAREEAAGNPPIPPPIPADLLLQYEAAKSRDAKFQLIRQYFRVREVAVDHTLRNNACYFLRDNDRDYLVRIAIAEPTRESMAIEDIALEDIALEDIVSGEHLVSLSKTKFLEIGSKRRLVELAPKAPPPAPVDSSPSTLR